MEQNKYYNLYYENSTIQETCACLFQLNSLSLQNLPSIKSKPIFIFTNTNTPFSPILKNLRESMTKSNRTKVLNSSLPPLSKPQHPQFTSFTSYPLRSSIFFTKKPEYLFHEEATTQCCSWSENLPDRVIYQGSERVG